MRRQTFLCTYIAALQLNAMRFTGSMNTDLMIYKKPILTSKLLEASRVEKVSLVSQITCARLAVTNGWPKLMCFKNEVCSLYDVWVHKDFPDEGGDVPCWTLFSGDVCGSPFEEVISVGCINIVEERKTFDEASAYCSLRAAQLLIPDNFGSLQQHLLDIATDNNYWVGVKGQKWINGDNVTTADWLPNNPDGPLRDCARIMRLNGVFGLADKPCTNTYFFICHRP